MAFEFKFYGRQDPDAPGARPLGEWTWDALPMGKEPLIDWQTGTVRSPLYQPPAPEGPVEQPSGALLAFDEAPADRPQWRVWQSGADGEITCAGGEAWIFAPALDASGETPALSVAAECHTLPQVALGKVSGSCRVVWRWRDGDTAGEVAVTDSATPPEGAYEVLLATVTRGEDDALAIRQRQDGAIFFTAPVAAPDDPGGDDSGDDTPPDAPPCGNPLNGGGAGAVENPLDTDSGGSSADPDRHPLDHEGDGGFTPYSSGSADC